MKSPQSRSRFSSYIPGAGPGRSWHGQAPPSARRGSAAWPDPPAVPPSAAGTARHTPPVHPSGGGRKPPSAPPGCRSRIDQPLLLQLPEGRLIGRGPPALVHRLVVPVQPQPPRSRITWSHHAWVQRSGSRSSSRSTILPPCAAGGQPGQKRGPQIAQVHPPAGAGSKAPCHRHAHLSRPRGSGGSGPGSPHPMALRLDLPAVGQDLLQHLQLQAPVPALLAGDPHILYKMPQIEGGGKVPVEHLGGQ